MEQDLGNMAKEKLKNAAKQAAKNVRKALFNVIKPFLPYIILGACALMLLILIICIFFDFNDLGQTGDFESATNYQALDINKTTLTREQFIKAVKGYKTNEAYVNKFAQYAGKIYDICTSKNINPILCVAQAGQESNFGSLVPSNSPWNYWGLGVYNDLNTGKEFDTIDDAIAFYCDTILGYQQKGSIAYSKAQEYAPYNSKITGNMNSVYDIFCAYMYLGDYHNGRIWGDVNAKTYLTEYMNFPCTHSESDLTTKEERAAYVVDYIDNHMIRIAIEIFGEAAVY